jgi:hypothetical protein
MKKPIGEFKTGVLFMYLRTNFEQDRLKLKAEQVALIKAVFLTRINLET